MIYYNNQLMPDDVSAILFMVTNPVAFQRYEDHQAAIEIQLHTLVEVSKESGENPIHLIEDYLDVVFTGGNTISEIANFLTETDHMQNALWDLKESWEEKDDFVSENSIMYGGISKEKARELYTEITLRTYLETLAGYGRR